MLKQLAECRMSVMPRCLEVEVNSWERDLGKGWHLGKCNGTCVEISGG